MVASTKIAVAKPRPNILVTRWLGGLDHPHYDDERNRYVWYEASAIAYQGTFVAIPTLSAAIVWITRSREAVGFTWPFMVLNVVLSFFVMHYTSCRQADCSPRLTDYLRGPAPVSMLALGAYVVGVVHVVSANPWMKSAVYLGALLAGVYPEISSRLDSSASSSG